VRIDDPQMTKLSFTYRSRAIRRVARTEPSRATERRAWPIKRARCVKARLCRIARRTSPPPATVRYIFRTPTTAATCRTDCRTAHAPKRARSTANRSFPTAQTSPMRANVPSRRLPLARRDDCSHAAHDARRCRDDCLDDFRILVPRCSFFAPCTCVAFAFTSIPGSRARRPSPALTCTRTGK